MTEALQLRPDENPADRLFAATARYDADISLLNYLLQDLRVLMRRYERKLTPLAPHQVCSWEVHGLERRTVVCDPDGLIGLSDVQFVGFFGERRDQTDQPAIDESEFDLIAEFRNYPGILSYSSIELVDDYWANLVVHREPADRESWRESAAHLRAVAEVAPIAYHGVRIHNGCIRTGVCGSSTVLIESTKYWDYDVDPVWHAVRELDSPIE